MAATTTTTADDMILAESLSASALETAKAAAVIARLFRQESLAGGNSKVRKIPIMGSVTAAALTEGTEMTPAAISTTNASITVAEYGAATQVTDVLGATSPFGIMEP